MCETMAELITVEDVTAATTEAPLLDLRLAELRLLGEVRRGLGIFPGQSNSRYEACTNRIQILLELVANFVNRFHN